MVATTLVRIMTSSDPGSEPYSASSTRAFFSSRLPFRCWPACCSALRPCVHFLRPDLANALRQNAGTASKSSQRFRKLAVGAQIALSVMLLGGAGCLCAPRQSSPSERWL
jgi:putative ABC transport system permease protein